MIATRLERHEADGLLWFSFKELDGLGFLKHWITSRRGGVSKEGYATLNLACHVGDGAEAVAENRKRVSELFCDGESIYLPEQVHSADVCEISARGESRRKCDALIVKRAGLPVGVLTADCLPIIIVDPVKRGAAVLHAGRRGVHKNIARTAVESLIKKFDCRPANLVAAIGPGIRECCYKVGEDVFRGEFQALEVYKTLKGTLDLAGAVEDQLLDAGVRGERILDCGVCTSCNIEDFFSHRRQQGNTGRFMTALLLK